MKPKSNRSEEFYQSSFSSGLRQIHLRSHGPVCHLAIIIKAGSRDELEHEQGMAHFVEHCLFKGTTHRRTYHILSRLDDVGGELNAYTGKEDTTLYATVLEKDLRRAAELLVDIAFHSTFPEKEINKEKDVIADEIRSYEDSPSDHIFDLFDEMIFSDHPLGRNILGTPNSVNSFGRQEVMSFTSRLYRSGQIILATSGPMSGQRVENMWKSLVKESVPEGIGVSRREVNGYSPQIKEQQTSNVQTHCIIGNRAIGSNDANALTFHVVNNILGGPTMNNRLNLNIRERYGLTYNLESFYTPLSDTGAWGVYLSTEPGYADRVIKLVEKELRDLREKKLGILQLSRAKNQVQGQIAMAQESPGSSIGAAARAWLLRDEIEPLDSILKRIDELSAEDLLEAANIVFEPDSISRIYLRGQGQNQN